MNVVVLTGRVATEPQLRYTSNTNKAICTFGVVVGIKPRTSFIPIELWENKAERAAKSLSKGRIVSISGELKQNQWEENGEKKSRLVVSAYKVELWDKNSEDDEVGGAESNEADVSKFFSGDED